MLAKMGGLWFEIGHNTAHWLSYQENWLFIIGEEVEG